MNIDEGVSIAKAFFKKHMLEPQYWLPGDTSEEGILLFVQMVTAEGNEITVQFGIAELAERDDPELVNLARGAMNALKTAHPELVQFKVIHEIF